MHIFTIPQKPTNTGHIHDLASDQFDREIKFPANARYAVVCSSFYGGNIYSTHKTLAATIKASKKQPMQHLIMNNQGHLYSVCGNCLLRIDNGQ
jgi:hypothetical protein